MAESNMTEVAQELLRQSKEHKVNWEESGKKDSYRVFVPDVSLSISRLPRFDPFAHTPVPEEEDFNYLLDLYSDSGRIIGRLAPAQEDPMHQVLADLFGVAEECVQQRGIDKALEYLKRS
jgi:hypothetical protein